MKQKMENKEKERLSNNLSEAIGLRIIEFDKKGLPIEDLENALQRNIVGVKLLKLVKVITGVNKNDSN